MLTGCEKMTDLFGKRCVIPTGVSGKPFVYRIISSDTKSNAWSEVPLTYESETNPVHHEHFEEILIVIVDTLIDEKSRLVRVARKDVELLNE